MSSVHDVAVVGHGYWGSKVADRIDKNRRLNLKYVVDENPQDLKDESLLTDFDTVLNDPDVELVAVFTPPQTHFKLVETVILADKNAMTTKPFVTTSSGAEFLVNLAKERDKNIFIDYTYLYSPVIRKIKELIDFDVKYIDYANANRWTGHNQPGVSVIQDLAPHILSIIVYLFPNNILEIVDVTKASVASDSDMVFITISVGGTLIKLTLGWAYPHKERRNIIVGSRKMITFDTSAIITVQDTRIDGVKIITENTEEIIIGGEPLQIELEEIADALDGKPFLVDMETLPILVTELTERLDTWNA